MRLEDYVFADPEGVPVLDVESKKEWLVIGNVYGRKGFVDGNSILTSSIVKYDKEKGIVETISGSVYELGEMNKDYKELVEAYEKGMPIVRSWAIRIPGGTDEEPMNSVIKLLLMPSWEDAMKEMANPKPYENLILRGLNQKGELVSGEIKAQEGNTVTLSVPTENEYEEKVFFIVWSDISDETAREISLTGQTCGLKYSKFEQAFQKQCRPVIFASS